MTKSEIKQFYNIDKIVKASELAKLSKTYRDNENTIIVMMKKKPNKPNQPPKWFSTWSEDVFSKVLNEIKSIKNRLTNIETRLDNLVDKNHLVE